MKVHLLLTSVLLTSFAAAQTTRNVPAQYATIEEAIDAAVDGDTVLVGPGTYTPANFDGFSFQGKAITVRSSMGSSQTQIDGANGLYRCFRFDQGEGPDSILEGFLLTGGTELSTSPNGGGVLVVGSSPVIRDCFFDDCRTKDGDLGSAGWPPFGPSPGKSGGDGAALYLSDSEARIERCFFWRNMTGGGGMGGAGAPGANGVIGGAGPTAGQSGASGGRGGHGAAIFVTGGSSPSIVSCVFDDNSTQKGGSGGNGGAGGNAVFTGFSRGGAGGAAGSGGGGGDGGAIYVDPSAGQPLIVGCTIIDSHQAPGGSPGSAGSGGSGVPSGPNGAAGSGGSDGAAGGLLGTPQTSVASSILRGNTALQVKDAVVTYSNVKAGYPGIGNIDTNPLFKLGSTYLQDDSPCIDAGDPNTPAVGFDYSGFPRVFDHPLISVPGGGPVDMGASEFVESLVIPYGCGPNPPGSLTILSGTAAPGENVTFGLTNPFGTQGSGALPYLIFSVSPPASSCGFLVNGLGMAGNAFPGAVLIDLNNAEVIAGSAWNGIGFAPIDAPLPNLSSLIGVYVHCQGLLLGGGTNAVGLSDAIQLVVGP